MNTSRCTLLVPLVVAFAGCASPQHQLARQDATDAAPLNLTVSSAPLVATVRNIIDPRGPGSWKQEAFWDEYVIVFANQGGAPLRIDAVNVIALSGHSIPPGSDPWDLEEISRGAAGAPARPSVAASVPTPVAASATASLLGVSTVYGAIGMKGPSIVYGAAALAVPVYIVASNAADRHGRENIEAEFQRRRLTLPLQLESGETTEGSLFFPVTRDVRSLVVQCHVGNAPRTLTIDLTPFAALYHRR